MTLPNETPTAEQPQAIQPASQPEGQQPQEFESVDAELAAILSSDIKATEPEAEDVPETPEGSGGDIEGGEDQAPTPQTAKRFPVPDAVRADYEALPPEVRTVVDRLAQVQYDAGTREVQKNLSRVQEAKRQAEQLLSELRALQAKGKQGNPPDDDDVVERVIDGEKVFLRLTPEEKKMQKVIAKFEAEEQQKEASQRVNELTAAAQELGIDPQQLLALPATGPNADPRAARALKLYHSGATWREALVAVGLTGSNNSVAAPRRIVTDRTGALKPQFNSAEEEIEAIWKGQA